MTDYEALSKFTFTQFLQKTIIDIEMILNRDLSKNETDGITLYKKIINCKHTKSTPKKWFRTDGIQYVKSQCDECGIRHGQLLLTSQHKNAQRGDENQHLNRHVVNQLTYTIYTEVATKISNEIKQKQPKNTPAPEKNKTTKRQKRYQTYMSSDAWRQKRLLVLERDLHKCTARMKGCTIKANHVHHVSYEFLGDEPLWDLQSVCVNCHRRIHN